VDCICFHTHGNGETETSTVQNKMSWVAQSV